MKTWNIDGETFKVGDLVTIDLEPRGAKTGKLLTVVDDEAYIETPDGDYAGSALTMNKAGKEW